MDPSAVEPFLRYLKSQRLYVDYAHVAAFTILFYDYLLMVDLEITTIWMQKWSYTKILFILTRYLPFGYAYLVIHNHLLLGVNPDNCPATYAAATWMVLVGITLAEIILAIRTWAVWRCDIRIGLLLTALHISYPIVSCTYISRYMKSFTYEPTPYPGFRGCLVVTSSGVESGAFIILTIVETVVFCLMATIAFQSYRFGLSDQFSNAIHRDAIHYYVFLMLLAIANIVVMLRADVEYQNMLTPLQGVLHSVFTSRIIINIRVAGTRKCTNMPTELHTQNFGEISTLVFQLEESVEDSEVASSAGIPRQAEIPINDASAETSSQVGDFSRV